MNLIKKLIHLEHEAADFGFKWEHADQIMQQIQSEYIEVNEHLQSKTPLTHSTLQEEIGDLLHAVYALCLFCKCDPEQTLQYTLDKFERRLTSVKEISKEQGLIHLHDKNFDELMTIWNLAKGRAG